MPLFLFSLPRFLFCFSFFAFCFYLSSIFPLLLTFCRFLPHTLHHIDSVTSFSSFPLFIPLYTNSVDFLFSALKNVLLTLSLPFLLFFFPFSLSSGVIYLWLPSRLTNDKEPKLLWFVFFSLIHLSAEAMSDSAEHQSAPSDWGSLPYFL